MEDGTQRPDRTPEDGAGPEVEGRTRRTGRIAVLALVGLIVVAVVAVSAVARLASPVAAGTVDDAGREVGLAACGAAEAGEDGGADDGSASDGRALGSEACVSSRSEDPDHTVIPLVCPQATLDEVVEVATSELSGVHVESRAGEYAHLVGRTALFGFAEDLELRTFGGVIDVRADARTPWADRGRARERVEELRETLIERGTCAA